MVVHYVGSGSGSNTSTGAGDVWIYANGHGYYTTTSSTVFTATAAAKVYSYGGIAATAYTAMLFNTTSGDSRLFKDNYATHKTPLIRARLQKRPRWHVHLTPTSSSWLNLYGSVR